MRKAMTALAAAALLAGCGGDQKEGGGTASGDPPADSRPAPADSHPQKAHGARPHSPRARRFARDGRRICTRARRARDRSMSPSQRSFRPGRARRAGRRRNATRARETPAAVQNARAPGGRRSTVGGLGRSDAPHRADRADGAGGQDGDRGARAPARALRAATRDPRRRRRDPRLPAPHSVTGRAGPAAGVALALVGAVLLRGGFFASGRVVFVTLSGVALLAAVALDDRASARALRSAPVVLLLALGALSAASAAWTVADPAEAVRTGLVIVGLAGVVVAAAVLARDSDAVERMAAGLVVLAAFSAILGLGGLSMHEEPWAQRIGGSWRPGGTFEYPPTLALLQVCALPALLAAMARARKSLAIGAAFAAGLAGAVLGLSDSRLQVGLAALVVLATVVWPGRTLGAGRRVAVAAGVLILMCGLAAHLLAGGYVPPRDTGGDAGAPSVYCSSPLSPLACGPCPASGLQAVGRARAGPRRHG